MGCHPDVLSMGVSVTALLGLARGGLMMGGP